MRLLSNLHVKGKPGVLPDREIHSQSHYFIYRPYILLCTFCSEENCNQKDGIAVGSLFKLVVANLAYLVVDFEQAVSIAPQESYMRVYIFFCFLHGVEIWRMLLQHLNNMHMN